MNPLPYGQHWLDEADVAAVLKVLRSDWITQGPVIQQFEQEIARRCGALYGVAFSSGTATATQIMPAIKASAISRRGSGCFESSRSQNHSHASAGKTPPKAAAPIARSSFME